MIKEIMRHRMEIEKNTMIEEGETETETETETEIEIEIEIEIETGTETGVRDEVDIEGDEDPGHVQDQDLIHIHEEDREGVKEEKLTISNQMAPLKPRIPRKFGQYMLRVYSPI